MNTTVIKSQADIERMYAGIRAAFYRMAWEPFLQAEMRLMEAAHAGYWSRQAGPSGKAWAKLAASTIKRKGHATILVDKTPLRDSLTLPSATGAIRFTIDEWPRASISFGTEIPYSHYHNEGLGQKKREHIGLTLPHFESMVPRAVDYAFGKLQA